MFRFTIRELLLVIVIAALITAWWIDRNRIADIAEQRDLWRFRAESVAKVIRSDGGQVEWKDDGTMLTRTDSAGRRRMILIPRVPYPPPPAFAKRPPGVPAGAPVPASVSIRPDSSNRARK